MTQATPWKLKAPFFQRPEYVEHARSKEDMEAIGRLRYQLYVQRDGKNLHSVHHQQDCIVEGIDAKSVNFFISQNSEIQIAVRLTRLADSVDDPFLSQLVPVAEQLGLDRRHVAVNSRFIVRPGTQARLRIPQLYKVIYGTVLANDKTDCLALVRRQLRPFFHRFGFIDTGYRVNDVVSDSLEVMRISLLDAPHLQKVKSPFRSVLNQYQAMEREPA